MIGAVLLALVLAAAPALPIRPDPGLTPGAAVLVTKAQVCTPGYSAKVRHVTEAAKREVYARYGIEPTPGGFEVDHLISLELGGSNGIGNLWPQSFTTQPWNARKKDALENRLHWLVCHRDLPLGEAQAAIRADWIAAYKKFVAQNAVR